MEVPQNKRTAEHGKRLRACFGAPLFIWLFDLCNRENRQVMGVVICCSGRLDGIISIEMIPAPICVRPKGGQLLKQIVCIPRRGHGIMSPTGAKRKLMTCASISELPFNIMADATQNRIFLYLSLGKTGTFSDYENEKKTCFPCCLSCASSSPQGSLS